MKSSRPKVEPIRNPTLFEMEKLEKAAELTSQPKIERPYSMPRILLGTSAFTAAGWEGSFYPQGMQSRQFLCVMRLSAALLFPRFLETWASQAVWHSGPPW